MVTAYAQLQAAGKAEQVGGLSYLNALARNTPSAANIRRYAEIVRDRAVKRRLLTVADEIRSSIGSTPDDAATRQQAAVIAAKQADAAQQRAHANEE